MSFTYLASPYTHPDDVVRTERFHAVCRKAAELMLSGERIFSPIAHSHPIDLHFDRPKAGQWWLDQDFEILRHASKLKVLMIVGWESSAGIAKEVELAHACNIPVEFIMP